MSDVDTSAEAVELFIQRCWLTDPNPERTEAMLRALLSERDALRTQLAEAQKPAPKGYPINLLVSGTIQAHQIAEDLGSGKIDKMEPFTRYDAARNALAEARDSAGEVWHSADLSEGLAPGESYLIYLDGGVQITALWVGKWMARGEVVYPTHWRQLPEPPRILSALADTE